MKFVTQTMSFLLCLCLVGLVNVSLSAQDKPMEVGTEFQWYPAGIIPALKAEFSLGDHHSIEGRLEYNRRRRQDWGKHNDQNDDERGDGFGLGIGYKYYFTKPMSGFFISGRIDVNRLSIDHRNTGADGQYGTADDFDIKNTKITVVQPTGLIGYKFALPHNIFVTPHVAGGWEVNVQTEGEPVGEGRIILLGVDVSFRL